MFRNLGLSAYFARGLNATATGTTTLNSNSVDLLAASGGPFDNVMAILLLNSLAGASGPVVKFQGSNDNATFVDLANTHQGPPQSADGNKLLITDVFRVEGYRYVRAVVTRGESDPVDGLVLIAYGSHSRPVLAQDATVSTPQANGSGGSTGPAPVNVVAYAGAGTA